MARLQNNAIYISFPFRVKSTGPATSDRAAHVREQIEQVLYTLPKERVFRSGFGAGAPLLVFEPNNSTLWEITKKRIEASLIEGLKGEADPKTIRVNVGGEEEKLYIDISYTLAAIGLNENHRFKVEPNQGSTGTWMRKVSGNNLNWDPISTEEYKPAHEPETYLVYHKNSDGSPGIFERKTILPPKLPDPGDDFDWNIRDYDSYRFFMLEELAAGFKDRTRWTPADMEVVIVEILSAMDDWMSDMTDRVAAEAFLETARQPESVRLLLKLIGYDALDKAPEKAGITITDSMISDPDLLKKEIIKLHNFWDDNPQDMEHARRQGPIEIRNQFRMVTCEDYATKLSDHPLVLRASSKETWGGSWSVIRVAVVLWDNLDLEAPVPEAMKDEIKKYHKEVGLSRKHGIGKPPDLTLNPAIYQVLKFYMDAFRMAGQEVILENVIYVGIEIDLYITVANNYYRSEIRYAIDQTLGRQPGSFFEPGRLRFGEDLVAGDILQAVMELDGIVNAGTTRFKRTGNAFPDEHESGRIMLSGLEIAKCDNDSEKPGNGFYIIHFIGGRRG